MKSLIQTRIGRRALRTFVLFLLPLVTAGWIGERISTGAMRRQTQAMVRVASDGAEAQVREFLQSLRRTTESRASALEIRTVFSSGREEPFDLKANLHSLQRRIPEARELVCIDLHGKVIASSNAQLVGADAASWTEFRMGRESYYPGVIAGDPVQGLVHWRMSAPVRDEAASATLGVVVVDFDPGALNALTTGKRVLSEGAGTQSFRMGDTGETYIVNTNGVLLTELRFATGGVMSRRIDTEPIRAARERHEEMLAVYRDYRGVDVTGATAILHDMGWILVTEIDFSQAFAGARALRKMLLWTTLLLLLAAGVIARRFAIRIVTPLASAGEADKALSAGQEAEAIVAEEGLPDDEIGSFIRQRNANVKALFKHERELLKEQGLRAKTAATLESISYGMVHEMRAPLRAAISFGELLNEEARDRLKPEELDFLATIKRACIRMDRLICDLLKYSELLHAEVTLEMVNIQELLRRVIDKTPKLKSRHIEIAEGLGYVRGNVMLLEQCLSVVLDNAVTYAKPDVPAKVRVWSESRHGRSTLFIEDNGVGMPELIQKRLFGLFERGTSAPGGSGIGLAVVRAAIERMGGEVGIKSEHGKGSCFSITLDTA